MQQFLFYKQILEERHEILPEPDSDYSVEEIYFELIILIWLVFFLNSILFGVFEPIIFYKIISKQNYHLLWVV